ncbi:MAG: hypothetical protein ND895_19080, partial [Pyrinomonadaceae bacterium]|nr:hypothetical protein [Pyrinomonadaceae bacterium]
NQLEYGAQLIVIIDDENPTFLHPAPICRNVRGRERERTAGASKATVRYCVAPRSKYIRKAVGSGKGWLDIEARAV